MKHFSEMLTSFKDLSYRRVLVWADKSLSKESVKELRIELNSTKSSLRFKQVDFEEYLENAPKEDLEATLTRFKETLDELHCDVVIVHGSLLESLLKKTNSNLEDIIRYFTISHISPRNHFYVDFTIAAKDHTLHGGNIYYKD